MGKKYYFSAFIVVSSVFVLNFCVFAQDCQMIAPVLSDDSISVFPSKVNIQGTIFIAQNTQAIPDDDELEEALFEDYEDAIVPEPVADPLYYFNYAMYSFNDFLYFAAIKPIARGYRAVTPMPVRKGVNNFFHNLLFPIRFVNNILQGKILDAGTEIKVFLINSTIGILGFGQVAQNTFDLHTSNEDLGQTLGSYSIGNGFYLVLPILGPSTLRDTVGLVGDYFLTPVNYVEPWEVSTGIKAYDSINAASFRLGDYEALKAAALDPYVAIRNAYIQNRKEKIKK
jgi:phospholipid-binding lipoprotein MlaA